VDQILAEEDVDGGTPELVKWILTDHLNTVRDIAQYDSETQSTTVVNHLVYNAYGNLTSETNSAVDSLFLFTARPFDPDTGLQNNLNRWYDPSVGRWLSEDPIEEDSDLYRYCGNSPTDSVDPLGLWKIQRAGAAKAEVTSENGDTIYALGLQIGLDPNQFREWLTIADASRPIRVVQPPFEIWPTDEELESLELCPGQTFQIPNTVYAYWAGFELRLAGRTLRVGKPWVSWNPNVAYLRSLGFNVVAMDHVPGAAYALQNRLQKDASNKVLHGLYFWGHGRAPYPSTGLVSDSGDSLLDYATINLPYGMALGLIFACDSNSGNTALLSGSAGSIWHGYTGTLYPFKPRSAEWDVGNYIKHRDQGTK